MTENVHIVLFGAPGSGKSSLLGALAQAGQSQTDKLGGQIVDVAGGMAELRAQTYLKGPAPTQDELRDYPVTIDPVAPGQGTAASATITDCSGQAAQAILTAKGKLPTGSPLARALLEADALILLADASANLQQSVAALADFVRLFQSVRGQRADIAGLPVYLVLTKCDTLAKPDETYDQWKQQIDEAKRKLDRTFEAKLGEKAQVPFGQVDLHVNATAVKRPKLGDRAAQAEPFGVAELFRQAINSAQAHHRHREHASGRLSLAVAGMFGLVGVLGLLAGTLYLVRPSAELTALENQVKRVLPSTTAADRLREPIDERLKELTQLRASPLFDQLPPKLREEVDQARQEMELYQRYLKQFLTEVREPRHVLRDEELEQIDKSLQAFSVPPEYLESWRDTKLVQRMQRWRADLADLRKAAKIEESWMRAQVNEALALHKSVPDKSGPETNRQAWLKQVQEFLDREPRHKRSDRLADGSALTYDHVYRLQRVEEARMAWDQAKKGLESLRKTAK